MKENLLTFSSLLFSSVPNYLLACLLVFLLDAASSEQQLYGLSFAPHSKFGRFRDHTSASHFSSQHSNGSGYLGVSTATLANVSAQNQRRRRRNASESAGAHHYFQRTPTDTVEHVLTRHTTLPPIVAAAEIPSPEEPASFLGANIVEV
jgi:hypothetical protein